MHGPKQQKEQEGPSNTLEQADFSGGSRPPRGMISSSPEFNNNFRYTGFWDTREWPIEATIVVSVSTGDIGGNPSKGKESAFLWVESPTSCEGMSIELLEIEKENAIQEAIASKVVNSEPIPTLVSCSLVNFKDGVSRESYDFLSARRARIYEINEVCRGFVDLKEEIDKVLHSISASESRVKAGKRHSEATARLARIGSREVFSDGSAIQVDLLDKKFARAVANCLRSVAFDFGGRDKVGVKDSILHLRFDAPVGKGILEVKHSPLHVACLLNELIQNPQAWRQ